MTHFRDPRKKAAYETALKMHDVLVKEQSDRGIVYRRGYHNLPYEKSWISYPIYFAGQTNRTKYSFEEGTEVGSST